ncbi:hypothetical protein N7508_010652 [Penicillium antarcticum]|uniref:uncharacterized protein n=1 Tax=Penicillium antarcticum TaxID=416450 RepID=UPI0023A78CCE|nr:uncharacterized protein N7508_010652 [Penicillium antarcticum]KAJ5295831.1 hypothetical protein N7508_010652 [Penicillium antarcticum]
MSVPSSGGTFSTASESGRIITPTSSQDVSGSESGLPIRQAPSIPRTLPTAQTPTFLFQNLQPDQASLNTTPRPSSPSSRLSPGRSPSTYADQHNASPSPRPRPIHPCRPRRKSREISSQVSSTSQIGGELSTPGPFSVPASVDTEDLQIPGGFPASSVSASAAGPSQENEDENEVISNDIRDETLPRAPIYNTRLQDGLKAVKRYLASLASTMSLSELTQDQSTSLHTLYKRTEEMSKFQYPVTRTVGFIGDSGVGKSSLINSLLDQKIARSSREGSACTCVATEFRHTDDTHTGPFTIEAEFMNTEEMRELLEHLLLDFRKFYVSSIYRELQTTEEQRKCQDAAVKSWETLQSLFKTQPSLTIEFLSDVAEGAHAQILTMLERWAYAGLTNRQGGSDALEYSVIAGDIEECKSILDHLAADNPEGGGPALWPFIKLIRVYLNSPILRTGLVLTDLPGLRDLNFARVRATERYLAHQCDEVFIVANISRAGTDESVGDIIRRCRQNQPRRIICTNSEDVSPEEASREQGPDGRRVREMNKELEKVKGQRITAKSQRMKSKGDDLVKWLLKETGLRIGLRVRLYPIINSAGFNTNLYVSVTRFLIHRRNLNISRELRRKYDSVEVFCVSNTLYSEHRNGDPTQADRYLDLTGIRDLRRYCQLVPAEAQMRATTAFLEDEVPAMVGSIRQWALSGTDPVTAEKAAELRRVLNESQEALRRDFQSSEAHVTCMFQELRELFNNSIISCINTSRAQWKQESLDVSQRWAGWHWASYASFCQHDGNWSTKAHPKERPWNEQFIQQTREALDPYSFLTFSNFAEHQHLAPHALQNIIVNMGHRRENIHTHIKNEIINVVSKTQITKRDMLEHHADSFISMLMKPCYNYCNGVGGPGSDRLRKDHMEDHLRNSRLFASYSTHAKNVYGGIMTESLKALQEEIDKQVEGIVLDFHAVVADEGEIPEAERAPALANELRSLIQSGQAILEDTNKIAQQLNARG